MKTFVKKPTLLIVDDNRDFREPLVQSPILRNKYNLMEADSCEEALNIITNTEDIDFILLDYDFKSIGTFSKLNGLEFLKIVKEKFPEISVIMTSGITENRGRIAIESIKNLADTFIDKPFSISELEEIIYSIYTNKLSKEPELNTTLEILRQNRFITNSYQIAKQFNNALKSFNELDISILITGETGTGKTHLAKALHNASKYSNKSFYEFHSRLLSNDTNSARSQLFGHTKGAYTGALNSKQGILSEYFTILFDDIHHLPLELQPFLLQFLESKSYRRFGDDSNNIKFNGKILATSIYSYEELKNEQYLIKELTYRFAGDTIHIPPLRERKEDIPDIIEYYLQNSGKKDVKFDRFLIQYLQNEKWYGNTRELISTIKRLVTHTEKRIITFEDFTNGIKQYNERMKTISEVINYDATSEGLEQIILNIRKVAISTQLKIHKGNISKTAKALGYKNHRSLIYWLNKLNINLNDYKS